MASLLTRLKRFDVYRDVPKELSEQTTLGAVLSVVSLLVLFALFVSEFVYYVAPPLTYDMVVQQPSLAALEAAGNADMHDITMLTVHLNMTFYGIPCTVLLIEAQDMYGMTGAHSDRMIVRTHVNAHGQLLTHIPVAGVRHVGQGGPPAEPTPDIPGCNVAGALEVEMVPGNFHISPLPDIGAIQHMFPNHFVNTSHHVHYLFFGPSTRRDVKHEQLDIVMDPLQGTRRLIGANSNDANPVSPWQSKSYEYFLKIVSTRYTRPSGSVLQTYQYTAHMNELTIPNRLPAIFFRLDFSPITVVISHEQTHFAHFVVQLCAILGGVFTVVGLLHRVLATSMHVMKAPSSRRVNGGGGGGAIGGAVGGGPVGMGGGHSSLMGNADMFASSSASLASAAAAASVASAASASVSKLLMSTTAAAAAAAAAAPLHGTQPQPMMSSVMYSQQPQQPYQQQPQQPQQQQQQQSYPSSYSNGSVPTADGNGSGAAGSSYATPHPTMTLRHHSSSSSSSSVGSTYAGSVPSMHAPTPLPVPAAASSFSSQQQPPYSRAYTQSVKDK